MADSAIAISAGTGTNVDTRTESTNGHHRQVIVIGDPATNAGVAPVDATTGLTVNLGAALPAGTNNIGDVDIASIAAGDNNIGNVDIASALPAGTNSIGGTKDNGPQWTSVFGVSGAVVTSADASTATAVTDAPTAGQKLVITDVVVSVGSTAMQVDLEEETSGTVIFTIYAAANTTYQITPRSKCKLATADKKLMVDTSAAGAISATAFYYSEA